MDAAMGTDAFAGSPPKPRPEESVEPKVPKRRSKNRLRNSMAWDKAFLVDEGFLQDPYWDAPLDAPLLSEALTPPQTAHPLLSEPLTPPRTTHRPAALNIPAKKGLSETGSRPPSRARTPDLSPFQELQSNTPIPSAGPSPNGSGAKGGKEALQESMARDGNFQQENDGALQLDDLPLAESPVLLTRKKNVEQNSGLLESSDSCMTGGSYSRPPRSRVSRASMAWDGAFQSGEGLLDLNLAENNGATRTTRAFDPVSEASVPISIESWRMEASSSFTAESVSGDDAESESSKSGLVGRVKEGSVNGGQSTPTKGQRRQKPAGLHRSSSTTVTIEAAIKDGTRLRLPGRFNPNPAPLVKPKSPTKTAPSTKTPAKTPTKTPSKPKTPTVVPPSKPKPHAVVPSRSGSSSHQSSPRQKASKIKVTGVKDGVKQGLDLRTSAELEALQAQLAAISAERDALQAKVSVLEGGSNAPAQGTAPESAGKALRRPNETGRLLERSARGKAQSVASKSTGLPAGTGAPQPVTSLLPKVQISKKDSETVVAPERQQIVSSMIPGTATARPATSRPSFLKQPTVKNDFFQTPTSSAAAKTVSIESPAGPSSASRSVAGGVRSSAESLRVPPSGNSQSSAATKALKLPGVSRYQAPPVSMLPKPSQIPQAAPNPQTSRYQSLLRKPAARGASGIAPPRSLKSGTFNASAIRSACSVPLPASPIGTETLASPSPAKKPVSGMQPGPSKLPGPSQLRKSDDRGGRFTSSPVDASTSAASGGVKTVSRGATPAGGSTFVSRLAAVSGTQTKIPAAGWTGLKPPGLKPPGANTLDMTSAKLPALPRPSAIDPAIIAAACAVPLPESLEGLEVWSSKPVLPRGVLSAPAPPSASATSLPSCSEAVAQTLKPPQPRVSFLRLPSTATVALVSAACRVALPPSPEERRSLPEQAPSPGKPEEVLLLPTSGERQNLPEPTPSWKNPEEVLLSPSTEERKNFPEPAPSPENPEEVRDGRCGMSGDLLVQESKQPQSAAADREVCSKGRSGAVLDGGDPEIPEEVLGCPRGVSAVGVENEAKTFTGSVLEGVDCASSLSASKVENEEGKVTGSSLEGVDCASGVSPSGVKNETEALKVSSLEGGTCASVVSAFGAENEAEVPTIPSLNGGDCSSDVSGSENENQAETVVKSVLEGGDCASGVSVVGIESEAAGVVGSVLGGGDCASGVSVFDVENQAETVTVPSLVRGECASDVSAIGVQNEATRITGPSGTMVAADDVGSVAQTVGEETNCHTDGGETEGLSTHCHTFCRSRDPLSKSALESAEPMQSVINPSAQKEELRAPSSLVDSPVEKPRGTLGGPMQSVIDASTRKEKNPAPDPAVDSPVGKHRVIIKSAQKEEISAPGPAVDSPVGEHRFTIENAQKEEISGPGPAVDSPIGQPPGLTESALKGESPAPGPNSDSPVEEHQGVTKSARKEESPAPALVDDSPVGEHRDPVSERKKQPRLSLPILTLSWENADFEMRIRAAVEQGENAMSSKSGRVQASPPDKGTDVTPVNPYSPVRKRERGPFDCTKRA